MNMMFLKELNISVKTMSNYENNFQIDNQDSQVHYLLYQTAKGTWIHINKQMVYLFTQKQQPCLSERNKHIYILKHVLHHLLTCMYFLLVEQIKLIYI